jgi:hypothetical protein
VAWGLLALHDKGGGPRIPTRAKMLICRMRVPIALAGVSWSGRLRRQTPLGDSCLRIAGSGGIHSYVPMFSLTVWRERFEYLLAINIRLLVLWCWRRMSSNPKI